MARNRRARRRGRPIIDIMHETIILKKPPLTQRGTTRLGAVDLDVFLQKLGFLRPTETYSLHQASLGSNSLTLYNSPNCWPILQKYIGKIS
ncbi:hypothetical protein LguiB_026622 [Lonicera macranthoides]